MKKTLAVLSLVFGAGFSAGQVIEISAPVQAADIERKKVKVAFDVTAGEASALANIMTTRACPALDAREGLTGDLVCQAAHVRCAHFCRDSSAPNGVSGSADIWIHRATGTVAQAAYDLAMDGGS